MQRDTLTLDTNQVLELWKQQSRAHIIQQLVDLARAGDVSLMVTARIRADVPSAPLADEINRLPELGIAEGPSVARLGAWVLGRDMLGADAFLATSADLSEQMIARGATPPDWRDWDHVHAHFLLHRDVFLTWDKALLDLAADLLSRLGLHAMRPEDYLRRRE